MVSGGNILCDTTCIFLSKYTTTVCAWYHSSTNALPRHSSPLRQYNLRVFPASQHSSLRAYLADREGN